MNNKQCALERKMFIQSSLVLHNNIFKWTMRLCQFSINIELDYVSVLTITNGKIEEIISVLRSDLN